MKPRWVLSSAVALVAALALAGCGAPRMRAQVFPSLTPPLAPSHVRVETLGGAAVDPDAWTNQGELKLSADLAASHPAQLSPEVEFLPAGEPFTGRPNVTGPVGSNSVTAPPMIAGQRYQWQIRAKEQGGLGLAGPWVAFVGTIGYEPDAPSVPVIHLLARDGYVATRQVEMEWDAEVNRAGTAGYAYSVDQDPNGEPPRRVNADAPRAIADIPWDGDWYFHVRTLDNAGNWSPVATSALHVDTVIPKFSAISFGNPGFNPSMGPVDIAATINKPAQVTVTILPAKSDGVVRTLALGQAQGQGQFKLQWNGKDDKGASVPPGEYRVRLQAEDKAGNSGMAVRDGLTVMAKRIVVSLGQEKLYAYDGDRLFLQTLVTTGGPELPTPVGTFHILAKFSPFTFRSPWPKGSPFWYADSPTSYAMLFDSGGYFIHDAPWRSWFGPGSNAVFGQPGGNGTGTHGCVNVPLGAQASLFRWTDVGTPVIVQS